MKNKFILLLIFLLTGFSLSYSQTIYSNGTGGGDWNAASTWLGGTIPNVNSDVIIAAGDSVNTTTGAQCNSLTVYSGGKLATSIDSIVVTTSLTLEADAYFYNATSNPKLPGSEYYLDVQSYVVHSGSGTVGGGTNLEYGNLIIKRNAGSVPGGNLLIHGNLIIDNTTSNVVFRGCRPNTGSQSHTVEGDLIIYKGTFSCIDVGDPSMVGVWNILGNVRLIDNAEPYFDARIGPFSSANADGLGIINIGGDLTIQGGRLQAGTSSSSGPGVGIVNLAGNLTLDINSATATNSLGSFSLNFVGNGTQVVNLDKKFQMSTAVFDTIAATSNVVFDLDTNKWSSNPTGLAGDFVVNGSIEFVDSSYIDGPQNFILNSGAALKVGSPNGITTGGGSNIKVTGNRVFSTEANYEYKSNVPQIIGDALPSTVAGFALNNSNGITLTQDLNVNSSVKITKGSLELNGHTITLGANAMLTETPGNTIKGSSGKVTITKELNAPAGVNVGGLGAAITSAANLGSTTIERTHNFASGGNSAHGINRIFKIMPANNSNLNATLKLNYDESELGGINENSLGIFKSSTGADNSWITLGGTLNTTENSVEYSGLADLHYFTLSDVNFPLPVEKNENQVPVKFALEQNYPNPFNPATRIRYQLPENSFVSVTIYDVLGNEIVKLVNEEQNAGYYSVDFNASNLSSGLYICSMKSGSFNSTTKMLLLK